jgi:hypothetical protein
MRKATDEQLTTAYAKLGNLWKVADQFGMCGQSVHERLVRLGVDCRMNVFTEKDRQRLRKAYVGAASTGKLQQLADKMGRTRQFICRQARAMGLTDGHRKPWMKEAAWKAAISKRAKAQIESNGHPRGMLGKKHCAKTLDALSRKSKSRWNAMTEDERRAHVVRALKHKVAKYGTLVPARVGTTWKASWRVVGGKRIYFRSRWEANYARYLQWLVEQQQITGWEHEPETFWFDAIKRGCVSYLPDFRVTNLDGTIEYHEVKGWMDARSKTKIKRMKKYYPKVKLVVIDGPVYKKLQAAVRSIIGGWEQ